MSIFKRKMAVFGILFFVSWFLFCPGAVNAAKKGKTVKKGAPQLVASQLIFEAGKVIEGKEVSHAFIIKNRGSGTLIIKQVKPGWGCSTVSFDRTIPPGKEGKVVLKVRTKGYRGNIVKGATVISNDPKVPRQFLKISINVEPLLICQPTPYISVSKLYGKTVEKDLKLFSLLFPNFKILKAESLVPSIKVRIKGKVYDKDKRPQTALKLIFGPDMKIGSFRGMVRIVTDIKQSPNFLIRVSGRVVGPVTIMPERGSMFSEPKVTDGMAVAGFRIFGREGNLKIKKTESTLKGFLTRLVTIKKGKKYYLLAIWPGGNIPRNPYVGEIRVYTNSAIQPVITIPVSVYTPRKRVLPPSSPPPPMSKGVTTPPAVKK